MTTTEDRNVSYENTLQIAIEEYNEVVSQIKKIAPRMNALRQAINGLCTLTGHVGLLIDHNKAIIITTPEQREEARRILK